MMKFTIIQLLGVSPQCKSKLHHLTSWKGGECETISRVYWNLDHSEISTNSYTIFKAEYLPGTINWSGKPMIRLSQITVN